ncbi:DUF7479 domain-containing protein [Haloarchaeobius sp. DFWS5]|uniref:DUF7479 domain-containing protein n=1 Tax=Haloarchaeobius sp. DFWS5 TaxID=3446114 RepID=UPI003EBDB276
MSNSKMETTATDGQVSEFDLACATCGGTLSRTEVSSDSLRFDAAGTLLVAECTDCGSRYFPRQTLTGLER